MKKFPTDSMIHRYKRHRFPVEIIAHAVWLYHRFPLSLRHVEDLLAGRDRCLVSNCPGMGFFEVAEFDYGAPGAEKRRKLAAQTG